MTYNSSPNCRQSISVDELLANTVETETGCLEWQKTRVYRGYGQVWVRGKMVLVHREMASLIYGPPKPKDFALHSCDNPPCINPQHLRWGTNSDNMKDMYARGRSAPKTKPHVARRLTFQDAQDIRELFKTGLVTKKALGLKYGISGNAIKDILIYKTYKI